MRGDDSNEYWRDESGTDATTTAEEWGTIMWLLCLIDGPLPLGDIVYFVGLGVLIISVIVLDSAATTNSYPVANTELTSFSNQSSNSKDRVVSDLGSSTASYPGPNRPNKERRTNAEKTKVLSGED